MVKKLRLVWGTEAKLQFKSIIDFIKSESPQGATAVKLSILAIIRKLSLNPEIYPPDKFKMANDGAYRAFEKYNYRVAYFISEREVRILRVRHVRQEPKPY